MHLFLVLELETGSLYELVWNRRSDGLLKKIVVLDSGFGTKGLGFKAWRMRLDFGFRV